MKPYAIRAAMRRDGRIWWKPLAYCEGCGKRITIGSSAMWDRVRIRVPEFRRNAICKPCAQKQAAGLVPPSFPWWYPKRPGWVLPAWQEASARAGRASGEATER